MSLRPVLSAGPAVLLRRRHPLTPPHLLLPESPPSLSPQPTPPEPPFLSPGLNPLISLPIPLFPRIFGTRRTMTANLPSRGLSPPTLSCSRCLIIQAVLLDQASSA